MNRDTLIGFVLIALVLIGFSWYNQPSAEEIEAARKQDSIAAAIQDKAVKRKPTRLSVRHRPKQKPRETLQPSSSRHSTVPTSPLC